MKRCIYCLKNSSSTPFSRREHVIPVSLGRFTPLNPTISARDGLVCDVCNTEVFGALETLFLEDSLEGMFAQRLNLQRRNSVILRNQNFKVDQLRGFGDRFFDQMFLFLKPQGGTLAPDLRDQIKLRRRQGGYRVFLPEALESVQRGTQAFNKLKSALVIWSRLVFKSSAETNSPWTE